MKKDKLVKTIGSIYELLRDEEKELNARVLNASDIIEMLSISRNDFYVAVRQLLINGYVIKDNSIRPVPYKIGKLL